jgi:hypothetical protein
LSTSKAEKSNTSAKGCWQPLWKFINLLAIPSSLSRSYSTFPLCLIEIAVCTQPRKRIDMESPPPLKTKIKQSQWRMISITLQGNCLSFLAWNSPLLLCKNYIFLNRHN